MSNDDTSSTDGSFPADVRGTSAIVLARGGSEVLGTSGASAVPIGSVPFAHRDSGSEVDDGCQCSNPVKVIDVERLKEPSPEPKSSKSRNKWPEITKLQELHGKFIKSHPFLNDNNLMDKVVIRHCLVDKPFKAPYGQDVDSWKTLAKNVNKEVGDDGKLLFNPPVSGPTLKERFKRYMLYAKESFQDVSHRSGCDDEAPPSEVQSGVEDLYVMYESFRDAKEKEKQQKIASRKEDKDAAESIRGASLMGQKPTMPEKGIRKPSRSGAGPDKAKRGMNPGGYADSLNAIKEQIRSQKEIFDKKHALQAKIFEFQKEQFQFKKEQFQEQVKLKKQKLEMEKVEKAANIEAQQAMTKCILALTAERNENNGVNKK
jgi:hypothetical protein